MARVLSRAVARGCGRNGAVAEGGGAGLRHCGGASAATGPEGRIGRVLEVFRPARLKRSGKASGCSAASGAASVRSRVPRPAASVLAAALIAGAAVLLAPAPARAVQAYPDLVEASQPSGDRVKVRRGGDERFHWTEDAAGKLVQRDPATKALRYVVAASAPRNGSAPSSPLAFGPELGTSEAPAEAVDARSAVSAEQSRSAYAALGDEVYDPRASNGNEDGHAPLITAPSAVAASESARGAEEGAGAVRPIGVKRLPLLVVVVGFKDAQYTTDYDWGNKVFRDDEGPAKFYAAMSGGAFAYEPVRESYADAATKDAANDGVVHVSLNRNHPRDADLNNADDLLQTLSQAAAQASRSVDLKAYDKNGDGHLGREELACAFVLAGYDGSFNSPADPTVWAHWRYNSAGLFKSAGGVAGAIAFDAYVAMGEQLYYPNDYGVTTHNSMGTLDHELGHHLGLPDLYTGNPNGAWGDYDVGYASLMASGSWAYDYDEFGDNRFHPSSLDAWSRVALGYQRPVTVSSDDLTTYQLGSQSSGYNVLRVGTERADEYFLVENRQFAGYDRGLSDPYSSMTAGWPVSRATAGLVVWHVRDDKVPAGWGYANTGDDVPAVMPVYPVKDGAPDTARPFWRSDAGAVPLFRYGSDPSERLSTSAQVVPTSGAGAVMTLGALGIGHVTGVSVSPQALSLKSGETGRLTASVSPKHVVSSAVSWTSSDPSVVQVDASGLVQAMGPGTATVTAVAQDGGAKATATATVTGGPVVVFESNGGSAVSRQVLAKAGGRAKAPANPTRAGYSFVGWYADKGLTKLFQFRSQVAKSTTLYAKWVPSAQYQNGKKGYRGFPDAQAGLFYTAEGWLDYAVDSGLMTGYTTAPDKGKWGGFDTLTRAMVAQTLYNLAGRPAVPAGAKGFTDLPADHWGNAAVRWAASAGVVTGYQDLDAQGHGTGKYTTFRPDAPVTREELATMLHRYAYKAGFRGSADVAKASKIAGWGQVSGWAREGVAWSVNQGLVSGVKTTSGKTELQPGAKTWRGSAAKMLTVLRRDLLKW